eukprot:SAG11_NODE_25766_length_354_cov_0.858824_1_plen_36_part_01
MVCEELFESYAVVTAITQYVDPASNVISLWDILIMY